MLPLADAVGADRVVLGRRAGARDGDGHRRRRRRVARRHRRGRRARLPAAVPGDDARLLARPGASSSRPTGRAIPGVWVHGDWASADADGFWFLHGRSDDTLNIAGKRIGPAELESAAVSHPAVREAAAIGVPHEVKGETAWIFCCLLPGHEPTASSRRGVGPVATELGKAFRLTGSSSWTRCRRRARRRSCAARCARLRSAPTPATCRRSRTPSRSTRSRRSSVMTRIALVTGGGRGIGANIARSLAADGWSVVVAARSRDQVDAVAAEIGGRALELDVTSRESVERAVAEAGDVELLVANAGVGTAARADVGGRRRTTWWRTLEVNVLGVHLCCRAVIPGMLERGAGRIVITGSGASYLPGAHVDRVPREQGGRRPLRRDAEQRARSDAYRCSSSRPGLVRTEMTSGFGDDLPWTPPELAPELVRKLATGALRRARRALPPRRARRHRRAARAHRRDPRARPERDPRSALSVDFAARSRAPSRARAARPRGEERRSRAVLATFAVERPADDHASSPASRHAATCAARRPSTTTPRPGTPVAYAPGQSSAAHTNSGPTVSSRTVHGAATSRARRPCRAKMRRPSLGAHGRRRSTSGNGEPQVGRRSAARCVARARPGRAATCRPRAARLGDRAGRPDERPPGVERSGLVERRRQAQRHLDAAGRRARARSHPQE